MKEKIVQVICEGTVFEIGSEIKAREKDEIEKVESISISTEYGIATVAFGTNKHIVHLPLSKVEFILTERTKK